MRIAARLVFALIALAASPAAAQECRPALALATGPGAMIALALSAPCDAGARVVIAHEGLIFTAEMPPEGDLRLSLPALAVAAEVEAVLPGRRVVAARLDVPEAEGYGRFGVQWLGSAGFRLHAFESGAGIGEDRHVSAAAPGDPGRPEEGGFLTLLGAGSAAPLHAAIYSAPRGAVAGPGGIRLVVELPVTPETCGSDLFGETLDRPAGAPLVMTELFIAVPDCGSTGQSVILDTLAAPFPQG